MDPSKLVNLNNKYVLNLNLTSIINYELFLNYNYYTYISIIINANIQYK